MEEIKKEEKDYEKAIAGFGVVQRIQTIANTSDEVIDMFEKTPIYTLLKQRREYCRLASSKLPIDKDVERMLTIYDVELARFFVIY